MKSNDDVRTNMKDQNYAAMSKHGHVDGIYPFPAVMQYANDRSRDPKRFDEAKRQHYAALYALLGAMRADFAQFLAFSRDAMCCRQRRRYDHPGLRAVDHGTTAGRDDRTCRRLPAIAVRELTSVTP